MNTLINRARRVLEFPTVSGLVPLSKRELEIETAKEMEHLRTAKLVEAILECAELVECWCETSFRARNKKCTVCEGKDKLESAVKEMESK